MPATHTATNTAATPSAAAAGFRLLPLSELHESPLNPRKRFDERTLGELAESLRTHGMITPMLARPNASGYEIAAGHRRFRAAALAGLAEVPVVIRPMSDTEFLEALTIENLQREDVHPLEEAAGYRELMARAGYDVETIAAKVGKSVSYVYQRLKLCELIPEAQQAFLDGSITAGHAILLARLQAKDQREGINEWLDRSGDMCSVRELARWIEQKIHLDLHSAPWKKDDLDLVAAAGSCVDCPKRTGFAPALFPDVKKKDTCTDPACFKLKMQAHIDQKCAAAKLDDGEPLIKLWNRWLSYNEKLPSDAVKRDDVTIIEKQKDRCEHARRAIVVEGDQQGKLLTVCSEKKCKQHGHRDPYGRDSKEVEKERAKARREKDDLERRREIHSRLANCITDAAAWPLGREDLEAVAVAFFARLTNDDQKLLYKRHGWEPEKTKGEYGGTYTRWDGATFRAHVSAMSDQQLAAFLVELSLAPHLQVSQWSTDKKVPASFLEAAKRHSIDAAAVEAEVNAEWKARAEAKKAKAKKSTKKTAPVQTSAKPARKKKGGKKVEPVSEPVPTSDAFETLEKAETALHDIDQLLIAAGKGKKLDHNSAIAAIANANRAIKFLTEAKPTAATGVRIAALRFDLESTLAELREVVPEMFGEE